MKLEPPPPSWADGFPSILTSPFSSRAAPLHSASTPPPLLLHVDDDNNNNDKADRRGELLYHSSVFCAGLVLLERAADGFIRHVSQLSFQLGVSPTLIALLTAGAEWEELVVVLAAIAHGASTLAIANVVGSAIANILGAFSLGVLFAPQAVRFDDSSRRFAIIQAGITTVVVLLLLLIQLQQSTGKAPAGGGGGKGKGTDAKALFENVVGVSLIVVFVLYFVGLSWAISRGMLAAPVGSDSDSESDSDSDSNSNSNSNASDTTADPDTAHSTDIDDAASARTFGTESEASFVPARRARIRGGGAAGRRHLHQTATSAALERTPLLLGSTTSSNIATRLRRRRNRAVARAVQRLLLALVLLSLAGYLLSHSLLAVAALTRVSDTVLGLTLLSFATTIPEKALCVFAGLRTGTSTNSNSNSNSNAQPPLRSQQRSSSRSRSRPKPTAPTAPTLPRHSAIHDYGHNHNQQDAEADPDLANSASSILMAGAAGSNVFLLTLCLGVSLIFDRAAHGLPNTTSVGADQAPYSAYSAYSATSVRWQELALLEAASLALVLVAYTDAHRWQGVLLLLAYLAFLVAEFTVLKR
ncbi:hypothetical protein BCV70DRAFT_162073 [Testicularia cyperi]|uniref:Sodium/calcium exchanger membrane region domain-containing protein n=1 Tax=Testicularia cyperi TaxID=1882483 RepID=A0A317XPU2_9BASI|nr:hypothetical protein BCV70DRAFT_162073 [Testicularia cyperi]